MPLTMMVIVINVPHACVITMYKCLRASLTPTHLPIASSIPFGHSHAHYLSSIRGYDTNVTHPCTISLLPFLLGAGDCNREIVTLKAVTLRFPGPSGKFWHVLTPRTITNPCLDTQSLHYTILKYSNFDDRS